MERWRGGVANEGESVRVANEKSGEVERWRGGEVERWRGGEQSERKNEQIPLFFPQLAYRPCSGETAIATWNLLSLLEPAGGI